MKNLSHDFGLQKGHSPFLFILEKRTDAAVDASKQWETSEQNKIRDQISTDLNNLKEFTNLNLAVNTMSTTVKKGDTLASLAYGFDRAETARVKGIDSSLSWKDRAKMLKARRFNITSKTTVQFYNANGTAKEGIQGTIGGKENNWAHLIHPGQKVMFAKAPNYDTTKDVIIQIQDPADVEYDYTSDGAKKFMEAQNKAAAKPEPKPKANPEAKPAAKPEPKPKANPEAKPAAKPEPKPKANPEAKPAAKPEPKPKANPEAKPAAKPEPKPKANPEAKPAAKPEPKPKANPEAKPAAKPEPKPKEEFKPSKEASINILGTRKKTVEAPDRNLKYEVLKNGDIQVTGKVEVQKEKKDKKTWGKMDELIIPAADASNYLKKTEEVIAKMKKTANEKRENYIKREEAIDFLEGKKKTKKVDGKKFKCEILESGNIKVEEKDKQNFILVGPHTGSIEESIRRHLSAHRSESPKESIPEKPEEKPAKKEEQPKKPEEKEVTSTGTKKKSVELLGGANVEKTVGKNKYQCTVLENGDVEVTGQYLEKEIIAAKDISKINVKIMQAAMRNKPRRNK